MLDDLDNFLIHNVLKRAMSISNNNKILLAEDDLFLREIYQEVLADEGFAVTVAVDGEDALSHIRQGGWDLVLLDDIMPKKSGIDVVEALTAQERQTLAKKIVFLTNIDNSTEIERLETLSNGHLLKSNMTPPELIKQIKKYLVPTEKELE